MIDLRPPFRSDRFQAVFLSPDRMNRVTTSRLSAPFSGVLPLGAVNTDSAVRNGFQSFLDDDRFGGGFSFFETLLAQTVRSVVDSLQGQRDLFEDFLFVLDEPQREILLVIVGAQFGDMGRAFGIAVPLASVQRPVRQMLDVAAESSLKVQK